jgi:hypothetical protein
VSDSCGIWHVAFMCAWLVLVVIASLIAWTLMNPSWDLMDYLTSFHVGWNEFVNMLIELLYWFFWFFLCWSFESLSPLCSNITLALSFELISHGMFLRETQRLLLWIKFYILLTLMISWVLYVYLSLRFPSIHWLTLWDLRLGHLSLSLLSYAGWTRWDGGHELWRSRSFAWSDWDTSGSPYACSWRSIYRVVLWHLHFSVSFFIHSLLILTWNVKMVLCSLDLIACILLLVRLDLFAACGVHWLDYSYFLCGLICSPLCVTMLWLWLMLFHHGVHLQYRCDFQLVGVYPCFGMSCPCDPHFSCCGWRVGFTCDRWWLFSLLWLLYLCHMCFDLLC